MTIQEAAYEILNELGKAIRSKEIARIALERGMVTSAAQDPIQSHAQTIEKNIRDGVYNNPKLVFIHSTQGRLVGLPNWDTLSPSTPSGRATNFSELKVQIPTELLEKLRLAAQAKLQNDFDETISYILTKGLSILAPEIKKGLIEQLDSLNSL